MTQFGESNDALLRMMFKEADEDGSGEIELDEFVHILKKVRRARGKTGLWLVGPVHHGAVFVLVRWTTTTRL